MNFRNSSDTPNQIADVTAGRCPTVPTDTFRAFAHSHPYTFVDTIHNLLPLFIRRYGRIIGIFAVDFSLRTSPSRCHCTTRSRQASDGGLLLVAC
jgi:hypothetical protein